MATGKRNVLTIATGKSLYWDLAINLARSFYYWNKNEDISFYFATDLTTPLPADIEPFINIISLTKDELGIGFSPKLHLEKLAPPGQTLFIDSDCLVYGNLSGIFEKFKGHHVSVIGNYISSGEWFGNITEVCKKFNVARIPKFNGGVYYLENGDKAKTVYETARELEKQYDEIGFIRLRNRPNDEVLMALAIAIHHETPIPEDGTIMAEFVNFQSGIKSDLLNGEVALYNNPANSNYQKSWPLQVARPVIVHYLGNHNAMMPYIKEQKHLEFILHKKYSPKVSRALTFAFTSFPWLAKNRLKESLRPVFRMLFGTRSIKQSERVITNG